MIIKQTFLNPSKWSRPQTKLKSVKSLIVHWVANPGTSSAQNRAFFNNRKDSYGSAHYIVDDIETLQCIPDTEIAYHVGADHYTDIGLSISSYPNARTLGIEMCHPTWTGEPYISTYKRLVELLAELCNKYHLNPLKDIYRHFDITSKNCPKFYVENEDLWTELKYDVKRKMR